MKDPSIWISTNTKPLLRRRSRELWGDINKKFDETNAETDRLREKRLAEKERCVSELKPFDIDRFNQIS